MKATVAERGQVTIPKVLRDQLGIRKGTVLDFDLKAGKLIAMKAKSVDPIDSVYGCLKLGKSTDAYIAEIRGKK